MRVEVNGPKNGLKPVLRDLAPGRSAGFSRSGKCRKWCKVSPPSGNTFQAALAPCPAAPESLSTLLKRIRQEIEELRDEELSPEGEP